MSNILYNPKNTRTYWLKNTINVNVPHKIIMWPFSLNLCFVSSIVLVINKRLSSGVNVVLSIVVSVVFCLELLVDVKINYLIVLTNIIKQ